MPLQPAGRSKEARQDGRTHPLVQIGHEQPIEHRTTLVKHPWTNGRQSKPGKQEDCQANPVKRFHDDSVEALKEPLYA
ncbi:MAG: hypothetical protein ACRESZ_17480 [Methylococcales bacterium]